MTASQMTGTPVRLPALGENVTEATVTRWLKSAGDPVEAGEAVLEVATDKVDTEITSEVSGTVLELIVAEGDVVEIGAAVALVGEGSATPVPQQPPTVAAAEEPVVPEPKAPVSAPPIARSGSRVEPLPRIRQTIARRMMESLHTSAQLTTVVEVDVSRIARLRTAQKDEFLQRTGVKLSFLPFFAKAVVEALNEHPVLNASVNADCTEIEYHESVHLGIAVDSPKGLMVPVIRDAQHLTVARLATAVAVAADDVRTGRIAPDSLTGGTFTLTNTGSRGALFDTPILNQPQTGILGTGTVVERVVPQRDTNGDLAFGVRSMLYLAISYDHRVVDGADAARFLGTVKTRLENGFTAEELR